MIIRIKKKLYFKPRLCPDCSKVCIFCKNYRSERCKDCHKGHERIRKRLKRQTQRQMNLYKYGNNYQRRRKKAIQAHPYCALCGTADELTTHHVGGDCDYLTVLCDECHQAYERWNNKRKVKEWQKTLAGGNQLIWLKPKGLKN